jgi:uncharacterized protein (TIGR02145 family)
MITRLLLLFLASGFVSGAWGQITLTFTAVDNAAYIRLDSIKVINRTQGGDFVLSWPDTTITFEPPPGVLFLYVGYAMGYPVGVKAISTSISRFHLSLRSPNPVRDQAVISMSLPSNGSVNIKITDIRGRVAIDFNRELKEGTHSFMFHPGDEKFYVITAQWHGITQSIKILTEGSIISKTTRLEYTGIENGNSVIKHSPAATVLVEKESGILDTPSTSKTYTFQFATNIPCPGTPTITYEGQVYNTIQIFSQCWLKENLNVGSMIPGTQNQTNNGILEKYCYTNISDSCTKYGGLYQWQEMMQYTTQQGVQGICPQGWHLPSDEEWKVMEGAVDSQLGIGDPEWDIFNVSRGYDAGTNLKTTSDWNINGYGTDLFGFTGWPGGFRNSTGYFESVGYDGLWWQSRESDFYGACYHSLHCNYPGVIWAYSYKEYGFSVRCLKDF